MAATNALLAFGGMCCFRCGLRMLRIKQIVRRTGHSRKLVRQVVRGECNDVFRTRQSSLDAHLPLLDAQWTAGCRNAAELSRRLRTLGFRGSARVVAEWATRRRRAEKADAESLKRIPSARTIARLMTIGRDNLSKADTMTVAAIESNVPALVNAREIIAAFHAMIRRKAATELASWIDRARSERGGERAALIQTAKLNDVDPQAWLADVLARIADHPISDLAALLPWSWKKSPARNYRESRCLKH